MNIQTLFETKRGCGYRKPGGLYLIGGSSSSPCCKLPYLLSVCRCCGQGVKPSRGFTWINSHLFSGCIAIGDNYCYGCPGACDDMRMGLMWVGEKYCPTPGDFAKEANFLGVSKRIAQLPKDVEPGKTWVALAHRKAVPHYQDQPDGSVVVLCEPGVFMFFKVQAVQYVVTGKESQDQLERLSKRGIELVDVKPAGEQLTIL